MIGFASFPTNTNDSVQSPNSECDIIILKNGEERSVKIIEITPTLVKYQLCNSINGPIISITKKDVHMIKLKDGTVQEISTMDLLGGGYAVTSLVFAIISCFIPFIGILAILFGAVGSNKKRRKSKMAKTGIIIGLLTLILSVIIFWYNIKKW